MCLISHAQCIDSWVCVQDKNVTNIIVFAVHGIYTEYNKTKNKKNLKQKEKHIQRMFAKRSTEKSPLV